VFSRRFHVITYQRRDCGVLMGLPKEIAELIERFERNREAYKSG
jgi:hypothetical protein